MLNRRFVVFLEGVVVADAAHFATHEVVVAVFTVLPVKFFQERLLDRNRLFRFCFSVFLLEHFKINFRLEAPDILVEGSLARNTMVWIEFVKWIWVNFVSLIQHQSCKWNCSVGLPR